jgi:hypothetical protein
MKQTRNSEVLADFVKYCETHPEERFWQCLRNWSAIPFLYACTDNSGEGETVDTFSWEGKNG